MKAVVLIGGFGTRLRPFTTHTPKPLLPLVGRPFLRYLLDRLKAAKIRDVVMCTAYRPKDFQRVFGNGKQFGMHISYVHESTPLGTGGAIKNAQSHIDGTTLICNGDILMDLDISAFLKFHRQKKAMVSLALTRVKDPTAYGLIETTPQGRIRRFIEKPSWSQVTCDTINAGFYLFEPEAFDAIPAHQVCSVERETFPALMAEKKPFYAKVFSGYWLDMGTVEKYGQAHQDILLGRYQSVSPVELVLDMVKGYSKS